MQHGCHLSRRNHRAWLRRAAESGSRTAWVSALGAALVMSGFASAQNLPSWPGQPAPANATTPTAPAGAKAGSTQSPASLNPSMANAPPPFVFAVDQIVPLAPPEWDTLQLRELEARLVNAPDDAARNATAVELDVLRRRMDTERAVVLLGRMQAGRSGAPTDAVVYVPAGLGGISVGQGATIRVSPTAAPFPSSALGEAVHAFPNVRRFGTAEMPGFIAGAIEPATATIPVRTVSTVRDASPWARRTATSLAESAKLSVEGALSAGPMVNGRVPMSVTVRNAGAAALPPCEVFFEFLDANGNLIHREFSWVTSQRSEALEAHLPALQPGEQATVTTPLPPEIAAQARSARVLILKALASAPSTAKK